MKMSPKGLRHLAEFEGMCLELYDDPAGHCTIGVGHLVHLGPCDGRASERPFQGGISEEQAYQMLAKDVARFEDCVNGLVSVPVRQHQFDALVSLAYNVGCGGFSSSPVLQAVNRATDPTTVWLEFALTGVGSNRKLPGLVRRRKAECALYQTPADGDDIAHKEGPRHMATIIKKEGSHRTYLVRDGKPKHIPNRKTREELAKVFGLPVEPVVVSKETFDFLNGSS